jgi:hypothetical protein
VINDGSAQRSMVSSVTVNFDGPVVIGAGAFELKRQDGSLVNLQMAALTVSGRTQAVFTFAGADIVGASLADGNYTLTVKGDLVRDGLGRALDGDEDGTAGGDRADAFFRLYGDSDGDRDVDLLDLGRFLSTVGRRQGDSHYLGYFRLQCRRVHRPDRRGGLRSPAGPQAKSLIRPPDLERAAPRRRITSCSGIDNQAAGVALTVSQFLTGHWHCPGRSVCAL